MFKSLGTLRLKKINTHLIQQGCNKLIETDSKDMYNVTYVFYLKEILLKLLFIEEFWKKLF